MARHPSDTGVPGRMPRLFVDRPLKSGEGFALDASQLNYLRNVMRLRVGDEFLAFNGRDGEWRVVITAVDRKTAEVSAVSPTRHQVPAPDLLYCFAPLKHARLDYMVQKATEMGAGVLQPVSTARTVAGRINFDRMRANVIEAAEQCDMLSIPDVRPMVSLQNLLDKWPSGTTLIYCDEAAPLISPAETLSGVAPGSLAVLVGPEGGFTEAERGQLQRQAFVVPISLGPRVMRADTAAVAALAVIQSVLGDWRGKT